MPGMSREEMETIINGLGEPWSRFMRRFDEVRRRSVAGHGKLGVLSEATMKELAILDERHYESQLADLIKLAGSLEDAPAGSSEHRPYSEAT